MGGKGGFGGSGEKWTKPCMHIWIIKEKKKNNVQETFKMIWTYKKQENVTHSKGKAVNRNVSWDDRSIGICRF
jgi:hypothetical protein